LRRAFLVAALAAVALATPAGLQGQSRRGVDAWGIPPRPLLAFGEVAGINLITWSYNYYIRDMPFASVYPLTWWHNIERGFRYDQNSLFMNMLAHPYHGSAYYNSARSNGIGFGGSAAMTLLGSFLWECCGERHAMAGNDVVSTTLGGIAVGEVLYRTSSAVLSNEAVGGERFGRELAGFLLNPIRGFNRLIRGDAFTVRPNPANPADRVPGYFTLSLSAGYRSVLPDDPTTVPVEGAFLGVDLAFGSAFAGQRSRPFDVFELEIGMYSGESNLLGSLSLRGNLITQDLDGGRGARHVWSLVQGFEYENTSAYQAAAQTLGLRLDSLWPVAGESWVRTRAGAGVIVFGTLDSPFGVVSAVPNGVRLRPSDYLTGLAADLEAEARLGRFTALAAWRSTWSGSLNHNAGNGGRATHFLHFGRLTGRLRLTRGFAVGGDYRLYVRRSDFATAEFESLSEVVPQFRLYGTWVLAAGRTGPSEFIF
jgi:hypothetical protein